MSGLLCDTFRLPKILLWLHLASLEMLALREASYKQPRQDYASISMPSYSTKCVCVCQFTTSRWGVIQIYQSCSYVLVVLILSVLEIISICGSMMMSA